MIVDTVKNSTTANSAVHYEVTLRIWPDDLEHFESDSRLGTIIRNAINGIAAPYGTINYPHGTLLNLKKKKIKK